jgi:hypothetical protein
MGKSHIARMSDVYAPPKESIPPLKKSAWRLFFSPAKSVLKWCRVFGSLIVTSSTTVGAVVLRKSSLSLDVSLPVLTGPSTLWLSSFSCQGDNWVSVIEGEGGGGDVSREGWGEGRTYTRTWSVTGTCHLQPDLDGKSKLQTSHHQVISLKTF